jgi:phosphoglycerate dehydrogenase-like enzyme
MGMNIVISIQQPVSQWQIPEASARALMSRFPDVTFTYARTDAERAAGLASADAAYTWMLSADELARAPRLRWVHSSAVAVETLCLPELAHRAIRVSNTRGVQAVPIAEHALAVVLALAKQIPFAIEHQQRGEWAQHAYTGPRLPWLLNGRTLGLIGLGGIGQALAARASALGMRVVALRRQMDAAPVNGVSAVYGRDRLHEMLGDCDVLAIAAPLTPHTDHLVDRTALAALKPGAVVVNVGRAAILDTDALVDALRSGHLAGAALDVFPEEPLPSSHPLWTAPNLILTPHTAGFRSGHWDDVIEVFADNLTRYRQGEPLRFEVDPRLGY